MLGHALLLFGQACAACKFCEALEQDLSFASLAISAAASKLTVSAMHRLPCRSRDSRA